MTRKRAKPIGPALVISSGEYEAAVAAFIRNKGVTRCPTACLVRTQGLGSRRRPGGARTVRGGPRALTRERTSQLWRKSLGVVPPLHDARLTVRSLADDRRDQEGRGRYRRFPGRRRSASRATWPAVMGLVIEEMGHQQPLSGASSRDWRRR
mgnify:CR=1 FL=1